MDNSVINYPTIPTEIVVHLGAPDEAADNISLPFVDYIKNVASNEIYPTWPDSAIEANILAQISFALNRIYNEWDPSRGYSFDILLYQLMIKLLKLIVRYLIRFLKKLIKYLIIIFIVKDRFNHLVQFIAMVRLLLVMGCHSGEV